MRRFLSLRDFDWTLLGFVMMLSIISVLEIYSATLHTKFHGFQRMQILWILGGMWRCSSCRSSTTTNS